MKIKALSLVLLMLVSGVTNASDGSLPEKYQEFYNSYFASGFTFTCGENHFKLDKAGITRDPRLYVKDGIEWLPIPTGGFTELGISFSQAPFNNFKLNDSYFRSQIDDEIDRKSSLPLDQSFVTYRTSIQGLPYNSQLTPRSKFYKTPTISDFDFAMTGSFDFSDGSLKIENQESFGVKSKLDVDKYVNTIVPAPDTISDLDYAFENPPTPRIPFEDDNYRGLVEVKKGSAAYNAAMEDYQNCTNTKQTAPASSINSNSK